MTGPHSDIGPELRKLAQTILDGIDPAVRAAAARLSAAGPGKCQQVWCPVCALAALISGEQHPLLNIVAEHSAGLLAVIRGLVDDVNKSGDLSPSPPPDGSPGDGIAPETNGGGTNGSAKSRYQPISVTVDE